MASFFKAVYIWVSQDTVFSLGEEFLSMYTLRIIFLCSRKTGNEAGAWKVALTIQDCWAPYTPACSHCTGLRQLGRALAVIIKTWMIQNMHLSSFWKSSERNTDTAASLCEQFPAYLCMRCSVRSYDCQEVEAYFELIDQCNNKKHDKHDRT